MSTHTRCGVSHWEGGHQSAWSHWKTPVGEVKRENKDLSSAIYQACESGNRMVKDAFMVRINPNGQGGQMFSTRTLCVLKHPMAMQKRVAHFARKVILFTLPAASFLPLFKVSLSTQVCGTPVYPTLYSTGTHFTHFCAQAL